MMMVFPLPGIEQRDRHVAASIQFQAGDKCQVKLPEGQTYRGEVTRLDVTPGCHMVCVCVCVCVCMQMQPWFTKMTIVHAEKG